MGGYRRNNLLSSLNGVRTVRLEQTGQGEFPKTVANHVFRRIDADEIFAVVNEEGVTNQVRGDH